MTCSKDHIRDVIKKHFLETLAEVTDIKEEDFDADKPMGELGASSLDVVEIVLRATRDLHIKVAPGRLAGVETVNALAAVFYEVGHADTTR